MAFDGHGACVRVPSQARAPAALGVQPYPALERGPFVWVWMGDAARADPALIPVAPFLHDPAFRAVTGCFDVRCSYVRLHENVLDLTHLPFLHSSTFTSPDFLVAPDDVKREGNKVLVQKTTQVGGVPPYMVKLLGHRPAQASRLTRAWFLSPALHYAEVSVSAPDASRPLRFAFVHAFSLSAARRTHYFWAVMRDALPDDADIDAQIAVSSRFVFSQDMEGFGAVEQIGERAVREKAWSQTGPADDAADSG